MFNTCYKTGTSIYIIYKLVTYAVYLDSKYVLISAIVSVNIDVLVHITSYLTVNKCLIRAHTLLLSEAQCNVSSISQSTYGRGNISASKSISSFIDMNIWYATFQIKRNRIIELLETYELVN